MCLHGYNPLSPVHCWFCHCSLERSQASVQKPAHHVLICFYAAVATPNHPSLEQTSPGVPGPRKWGQTAAPCRHQEYTSLWKCDLMSYFLKNTEPRSPWHPIHTYTKYSHTTLAWCGLVTPSFKTMEKPRSHGPKIRWENWNTLAPIQSFLCFAFWLYLSDYPLPFCTLPLCCSVQSCSVSVMCPM